MRTEFDGKLANVTMATAAMKEMLQGEFARMGAVRARCVMLVPDDRRRLDAFEVAGVSRDTDDRLPVMARAVASAVHPAAVLWVLSAGGVNDDAVVRIELEERGYRRNIFEGRPSANGSMLHFGQAREEQLDETDRIALPKNVALHERRHPERPLVTEIPPPRRRGGLPYPYARNVPAAELVEGEE